jgi:hypothetical protein
MTVRPATRVCFVVALACLTTGCGTVINTGAGELAGIAGAAVAGAVTTNPGVAAGIGLGAQAGARTGVQYWQREVHRTSQERIADAAGPLAVGEVTTWQTEHRAPLEHGEQGRVTVSRVVSTTLLECKEVVFSVDTADDQGAARSAFYVAMLCRDGARWRWATAEPSTRRWSGLQ